MRTEIIEILQRKYPEYCIQHIDTADEILRLFNVEWQSEHLANFCKKISKQEDCPAEFKEIINKEFWNLIG